VMLELGLLKQCVGTATAAALKAVCILP